MGDVDEARNTLSLNIAAPQADYAGYHFENLEVDLSTPNHTLDIALKGEWVDKADRRLALQINGTAANNALNTLSSFNTFAQKAFLGQINCIAQFERQGSKLATHLHFAPQQYASTPSNCRCSHRNLPMPTTT